MTEVTRDGILHELHRQLGANFTTVNDIESVRDYGDFVAEHAALRQTAGVLDLSCRSRLCLTCQDRVRFLHGQVTNDVKRLRAGEGCYAALVTAKGKMQSDLNIYCLEEELLLDFEPGLAQTVSQRLEKYVIADDVQIVEVGSAYGLLSVQGPQADVVTGSLGWSQELPQKPFDFFKQTDPVLGEIYLINQPRLQTRGVDLFIPTATLGAVADKLISAAKAVGGRACGWQAFETARIEAGIPRFGVDMDETNLPLEAGIEGRAISFAKGCYIGQEVISRIRTYGQVAKALRGLVVEDEMGEPPVKGDKLLRGGKEVGYITSAVSSPTYRVKLALGYVRKEVNQVGTELTVRSAGGEAKVRIVSLPLQGELKNS